MNCNSSMQNNMYADTNGGSGRRGVLDGNTVYDMIGLAGTGTGKMIMQGRVGLMKWDRLGLDREM